MALLLQLFSVGTLYPMAGIVTDLKPETNSVIIETSNGHAWSFDGIDDWSVGYGVVAIMFDPDTPLDCTDDMILSVRYMGYVDIIVNSSAAER